MEESGTLKAVSRNDSANEDENTVKLSRLKLFTSERKSEYFHPSPCYGLLSHDHVTIIQCVQEISAENFCSINVQEVFLAS